ncbi:glycerol-3-phosphate 1-O-acyltransferase PlsB [Aliagarivorans taiwanensis]|uniref:glycerol-3-phosphate 1-O-acyltransferase PlsB n=1 Tax=Aliagarivorans taiwanensis TaxID=561966 RepID=UPI00047CFD0B|nr:glycerol-3-phosphate 1-O-acyltransferase PlsB [Aliagarivorans taiwanensis]
MSRLPAAVLFILRTMIRWLTRGKVVPQNPIEEFQLDLEQPIIYVIPHASVSDLLTLQIACKNLGMPDPLEPQIFAGKSYKRVHYLMDNLGETLPETVRDFTSALEVHQQDDSHDAQLLPVKLFWDRYPGREKLDDIVTGKYPKPPGKLRKILQILFKGRENLVRFSQPVSMREMAQRQGADQRAGHKLARVARIHFSRMQHIATGPKLPNRRHLFEQLLASPVIRQAIRDEAAASNIELNLAQQKAQRYLDEIATDFSYQMLRAGDGVLSFVWNKIYSGISVNNAEAVRKLAQEGHEIVFAPCHRSHMDYLLLSYVLYHQGMMPPHIAAGINLNFWPAGPIFRRGGAFFIRRSFKGNKLYSIVFREYLNHLFARGYSVEYFTEGGRSRTGRLLPPKTGMLAMTVQAMLRGLDRPVTIVPIYFGYEHVMEVSTYYKELKGKKKEKESIFSLFTILRKLRNFGNGYVNFGEPINVNQMLNQLAPEWRDSINSGEDRPAWLVPSVNQIADQLMVNINSAAAVNGLCLAASVLTVSENYNLPRQQLTKQMQLYLDLLRAMPYSEHSSLPEEEAGELLEHALSLGKFEVEEASLGSIISLNEKEQVLQSFYRNNVIHLLIIPALIATAMLRQRRLSKQAVVELVAQLYPLLQGELYMHYQAEDIPDLVERYLEQFTKMKLLEATEQGYQLAQHRRGRVALLASLAQESLHRYAVVAALAVHQPELERSELEKQTAACCQSLSQLHKVNAPEYYDKKVFSKLISLLKEQGYLDNRPESAQALYDQLAPLLAAGVYDSINELLNP